jgi:hypothetical protein
VKKTGLRFYASRVIKLSLNLRTKKENTLSNEYRGFSLFNDIEDVGLRNRNRAVILTNIATNHSKNRKISPGGGGLMLGYFNSIPVTDRHDVTERFVQRMKEEGFHLTVETKHALN